MPTQQTTKPNTLLKLNTLIIITSLISLLLGIADMTLDILHTSGNAIGIAFLVLGIVMSIPGLIWIIASIVLLVKDKNKKIVCPKLRIMMIVIVAISIATFIPLWIEGFIPGNGIPMFDRLVYRQVIWMIVWTIYLITCLSMFLVSYSNRCKYLYKK